MRGFRFRSRATTSNLTRPALGRNFDVLSSKETADAVDGS